MSSKPAVKKVTRRVTATTRVPVSSEPKKDTVEKAAVVAEPVVEPAVELEKTKVDVGLKSKKKRQRPKQRNFQELYDEISENINSAYKLLQAGQRSLKSLLAAHNREVHSNKVRESSSRTPTIVFDQALVDYFRSRLPTSELTVTRKHNGESEVVDLSDLSTESRVHRTDVTQLYSKVFKRHNMQNPDDRRNIMYSQDKELVSLLTTGDFKPEYNDEIQEILSGEYRLTIFNIQRFTNHHLGKVDLPSKSEKSADAEVNVEVNA